jgi:hypothetical protein
MLTATRSLAVRARRRAALVPGGLLLLAACAGCQMARLAEVEGTLTCQGRPLANVQVEFIPDAEHGTTGPRSTGVTDSKGHFVLRCDDQRPGAVVGQHCVVLQPAGGQEPGRDRDPRGRKANQAADGAAPVEEPITMPAVYQSAGSTPLRKAVKRGSQTIDLEIVLEQ